MFSGDIENFFFKRISQLRNQKGVSARDMSLSLGQNENYINNIENKKSYPSMSGFFYICEYFGLSPKEFFNDEVENPVLTLELLSRAKKLKQSEINHFLLLMDDLIARDVKN